MSRNWLIGGGLFLAVLLVASVVVALMEDEESFAEGSVEEAVQLYLKAVEDDDFETAYGFLSSELKAECSIEEFVGGGTPTRGDLSDDRITLEKTTTVDETVFVTIRVTRIQRRSPFGTSESSFEQRFSLRQQEGDWRFTEYPQPFFRCGPFKPVPVPRPPAPRGTFVPAQPTQTPGAGT